MISACLLSILLLSISAIVILIIVRRYTKPSGKAFGSFRDIEDRPGDNLDETILHDVEHSPGDILDETIQHDVVCAMISLSLLIIVIWANIHYDLL